MRTNKPLPPTSLDGLPGSKTDLFPIVGIGASAGGLEAFEQFFRQMPADTGMAFVLIPHLDPSHASLLTEILQRSTQLPVHEALDQTQVEPNCVYVIPPNREMTIFHDKLLLNVPNEPHGQRMPIDAFLRSLAEDRQENAIGIILSGTGTDGTLGLRAIQGAGGLTLAQEPSAAKYGGMPQSAINASYADVVLPAGKMPDALLAALKNKPLLPAVADVPASVEQGINSILQQLRALTGNDFSLYKKSTISRRIERRMQQHNIENPETYVRYLKENPPEVHLLFKELLINVTSFFRDPEAFDILQQETFPLLLKDKPPNYPFRVWVAGCASGEEAYSIAMLLHDFMEQHHKELKVQIYSTDLDDDVITIARAGLYPPNIVQDVTAKRLKRYFTKEEGGYRIKKEIREMVIFAIQNVIKDPPFTKLDLLSCRNLMIYLKPELQDRLVRSFHYALKPGGVLFLSSSESIGGHHDLFSPLSRKWKLYTAIHALTAGRALTSEGLPWSTANENKNAEYNLARPKDINLAEMTRRVLVQLFAPVSVVTDTNGIILYINGDTGKFLRPAPGNASFNIVDMAREGLELELRAAIHAAVNEGMFTLNRIINVKSNGGYMSATLSVRVLPGQADGDNLLLVSFQELPSPPPSPKGKRTKKPAELSRIDELERDLAYQKENNQAIIEEQQASNEELKSTNEELQSANEELQSSNEELETSKEELQSVNEELITVNSELQGKIEQLANMQNDMKNLMENISIGMIFLDRHLKIRSFTREAIRVYRLATSDIGRSLADIRTVMTDVDLLPAAQTVLDTLIPHEREMGVGDGTWMLVRIQPYRTLENMIDGVVLTFTDISERMQYEATLRLKGQLIELSFEPIFAWSIGGAIIEWNQGCQRLYGYSLDEVRGAISHDLLKTQFPLPIADIEAQLLAEGVWAGELRHRTRDGCEVIVESRWQLIETDDGHRIVLEANRDITERIKAVASEEAALAERIVKTIREPFIVLDGDLKVMSANDAFYQSFQVNQEEVVGKRVYDLPNQQWDTPDFHKLMESLLNNNDSIEKCLISYKQANSGVRQFMVKGQRIVGKVGEPQIILLSIETMA